MKKLFALGLSVSMAACSSTITESAGPAPVLTELPRSLTTGEQHVVTATNDFTWSLFRQLSTAQKNENIFASPLSASMALGMTMNGTAGATYDQMRSALAFGAATDAEINGSYKDLITLLRSLDKSVDVRVANSIWYAQSFPVKQAFIDVSKSAFDAEVTPLNFASAASLGTINGWVNTATNGAITSILDKINQDDVMFLVNAIYFKGSWRQKFDPSKTTDAPFHGIAGDQAMRLMQRNGAVRALFRPDLTAAELFYGDSAYSMVVLVPQGSNTVDALASTLNTSTWSALIQNMYTANLDVLLPRLKLEWERTLNPDLQALGMRDAFSDGLANFSRMTTQSVVISKVKQKAYVDINEEGTTAAAVTSVGITLTSAGPPLQVRVDRPFIFAIRERLTGTILFVGKIVQMP